MGTRAHRARQVTQVMVTIRAARGADSSNLAGEVYRGLRNRILRGELGMGHPISRRKLAAELTMSTVPVSEALLWLEQDGLLESRPRAGTRVRILTWEDVEGCYVIREALEAQASTLFAEKATRSERSELMKLAVRIDNMSRHPEGNRTIYLTLHEKLHRRIAECTGCQTLLDALMRVSALASLWLFTVPPGECEVATHEILMKTLVTSDPVTVALSMREHVRSEREVTLRSLKHRLDPQKLPQTYSRGDRIAGCYQPPASQGILARSSRCDPAHFRALLRIRGTSQVNSSR